MYMCVKYFGIGQGIAVGYYFIVQAWNIEHNPCSWSIFINSAYPSVTKFDLRWYSMFISLFTFRFLRNCREIEPCQTSKMGLFAKVVTFLTKPFYMFVEYLCNIPLIYSQYIRENSQWNSGEYSEIIMSREYWIQENSQAVPWISYECYRLFLVDQ